MNVVSPGMAEDSADVYGSLFPELPAVPMKKIEDANIACVEGSINLFLFPPGSLRYVRSFPEHTYFVSC